MLFVFRINFRWDEKKSWDLTYIPHTEDWSDTFNHTCFWYCFYTDLLLLHGQLSLLVPHTHTDTQRMNWQTCKMNPSVSESVWKLAQWSLVFLKLISRLFSLLSLNALNQTVFSCIFVQATWDGGASRRPDRHRGDVNTAGMGLTVEAALCGKQQRKLLLFSALQSWTNVKAAAVWCPAIVPKTFTTFRAICSVSGPDLSVMSKWCLC